MLLNLFTTFRCQCRCPEK